MAPPVHLSLRFAICVAWPHSFKCPVKKTQSKTKTLEHCYIVDTHYKKTWFVLVLLGTHNVSLL